MKGAHKLNKIIIKKIYYTSHPKVILLHFQRRAGQSEGHDGISEEQINRRLAATKMMEAASAISKAQGSHYIVGFLAACVSPLVF